jgi:hypothetical protein
VLPLYFRLELAGEVKETSVRGGATCPSWEEVFQFEVGENKDASSDTFNELPDLMLTCICLDIHDYEEVLGSAAVNLGQLREKLHGNDAILAEIDSMMLRILEFKVRTLVW